MRVPLLLGFVAFSIVAALVWFFGKHADTSPSVQAAASTQGDLVNYTTTATDDAETARKFRRASARIAALEARLRALETRSAVSARSHGERSSDGDNQENDGDNQDNLQDLIQVEHSAEEENAKLVKMVHQLDSMFESEGRDVSWAGDAESQISSAFKAGEFTGTILERADCHATFCRVVAVHETEESRSQFEGILNQVHMGALGIPHYSDGKPMTAMYFVGKEHDNSDHPVRRAH